MLSIEIPKHVDHYGRAHKIDYSGLCMFHKSSNEGDYICQQVTPDHKFRIAGSVNSAKKHENFGVRISINYNDFIDYVEKNHISVPEFQKKDKKGSKKNYYYFFSYIDKLLSSKESEEIEKEFQKNSLQWAGNTYKVFGNLSNEYIYNNEYYVRFCVNSNNKQDFWIPSYLVNGDSVYEGSVHWFKVAPILWEYDDYDNTITTTKAILPYTKEFEEMYKGDFRQTKLYYYLNTSFIKELMYHPELIQNLNAKESKYNLQYFKNIKEIISTAFSQSKLNNIKGQSRS